MKTIIVALLVTAAGIAHAEQHNSITTNATAVLTSHGFQYVATSDIQKETFATVIDKLKLVKQTKVETRTIDQAVMYLWKTINIAVIQTPRACTEYNGFFWFSRLDTAGKDDGLFLSGFAVKKDTGEIYRWEEGKPQPPSAGDSSTRAAAGLGTPEK